jgi:hypothetical protein
MHDEKDFLAAHGCKTTEEYDRKQFFEWVDAMEDHYARTDSLVIPKVSEGVVFKSETPLKPLSKQSLIKYKQPTDGNQAL